MVILSTKVDLKLLETEFLIAVCRPFGDKSQSKRLFLAIFDPRSSIVKSAFDCPLPTTTIFGLLLEWVEPIYMHTMNPIVLTCLRPMEFSITLHTVKSGWSIIHIEG